MASSLPPPTPIDAGLALQLERLARYQLHRPQPDPRRVASLLAAMRPGWPAACRPPRGIVQVVGTNGKGSTTQYLALLLAAATGWRVGVYLSPHLRRINERLVIAGQPVSDERLAAGLAAALDAAACVESSQRAQRVPAGQPPAAGVERSRHLLARGPPDPGWTWFELVTAAAVHALATADLDCWVLEAGLGGRLDATTALVADWGVLTSVALDHCQLLGRDLPSIAAEKLAAFGAARQVIAGPQDPAVAAYARQALGERLLLAGEDFWLEDGGGRVRLRLAAGGQELELPPLAGRYRREALGLALAAAHAVLGEHSQPAGAPSAGRALAPGAGQWAPHLGAVIARLPVERFALPGRLQLLAGTPPLLLDVAHNPAACAALVEALAELRAQGSLPVGPLQLVFGAMADKDAAGMLAALRPSAAALWLPRLDTPRAMAPEALLALAGPRRCQIAASPATALADARAAARLAGGAVLVTGSFYLVGPVLEALAATPT